MEENRPDRIDKVRDTLYQIQPIKKTDTRRVIHEREFDVKTSFDDDELSALKQGTAHTEKNISLTIFLIAIVFFVGASLFASWKFFFNTNDISANAIDLRVTAPTFVEGGQTFPISVSIGNQNPVELQFTDLTIEYSKGESVQAEENKTTVKKTFGTIAPGTLVQDSFDASLFGTEGSVHTVLVKIEYSIPGSTAIFQKTTSVNVSVKSSPITLTTDALKEVSTNQDVAITINVAALRGQSVENMVVQADYPNGFQFASSDPKPTASNNVWSIGSVLQGETKKITIHGTVHGDDGDERTIRVNAGVSTSDEHNAVDVVLSESDIVYSIKKPFLAVDILVNEEQGDQHGVVPGSDVKVELHWKNTLATSLKNASFVATLSGAILDRYSITPGDGYYDSRQGTITWDNSTNPDLATIAPGQTGTFEFHLKTLQPSGTASQNVEINVGVKARRVSEENVTEELSSSQETILKPESSVKAAMASLYYDGPITNSGPIPPKADTETTYTVGFTITNSSNPLKNGGITFKLPLYTRFTSKYVIDAGTVSYEPSTRQVTWSFGDIAAGVGTNTPALHGYIQLGVTPSVNAIGRELTIIPSAVFNAVDTVTGTKILQSQLGQATTRIFTDSGFKIGLEIVGSK